MMTDRLRFQVRPAVTVQLEPEGQPGREGEEVRPPEPEAAKRPAEKGGK